MTHRMADVGNSYAAPGAPVGPGLPGAGGDGRSWRLAWVVVFAGNLVLPLAFGWLATQKGGRAGLVAATALWLVVGLVACGRPGRGRFLLVFGGLCVAATQLIPLLQITAGVFGLSLTARLLGLPTWPDDPIPTRLTDPGAFLATLLTGGLLLAAACACGQVVWWLSERLGPRLDPWPADPRPDDAPRRGLSGRAGVAEGSQGQLRVSVGS